MQNCIVVMSRNVDKWGAERSTCSLCHGLQNKGYKVIVVLPRLGSIIELLDEIHVDYIIERYPGNVYEGNIPFRRLLKTRVINLLQRHAILKRIQEKIEAKGLNPILVYSNTLIHNIGIYLAKQLHVPHVQHIRENINAFHYSFINGYKSNMNLVNSNSDLIMCTCEAVRKRYINELLDSKLFVVHNGVPPVSVSEDKRTHTPLKILQIARFMDDKRIIDSLNAIRILKNKGIKDIELHLYGQGPEETQYRDFIIEFDLSDQIFIDGFSQSIPFNEYHIGLMTSSYEAFARSVLDYMNNGLAVIASNTGGNLEQVEDGVTGRLFEVKNPDALADEIVFLYNNREYIKMMGEAGRRRFLNLFTQEKYVENATEHIINVIKQSTN